MPAEWSDSSNPFSMKVNRMISISIESIVINWNFEIFRDDMFHGVGMQWSP